MARYIVQRIVMALVAIWLVATMTFVLARAMPGSPVQVLAQEIIDKESDLDIEEARNRALVLLNIRPERSLGEQYLDFMRDLAHGNLGMSYRKSLPVSTLIAQRLPWTVFSVGISLLISFTLGTSLGLAAAYRRNSWLDHLLTNAGAILDAVPTYLIATLVIILAMVCQAPIQNLPGSFSPGAQVGMTMEFFADALKHLLMPALAYILSTVGAWALLMRDSAIGVLGAEYVTVARARGLPGWRIATAYVGRNASLPIVRRLAILGGLVVSGAIIIEIIFRYQGIGLLLAESIDSRDYPLMQGIFLVTTIAVIASNIAADLFMGWLDPRIRMNEAR